MANDDITRALLQLAVATREHVDEGVLAVYEEDLVDFPAEVVVEACRRVRRTAQWFPKVTELLETCRAIESEQVRNALRTRYQTRELPMTPEEHALGLAMRDDFLEKLRSVMRQKRMS